MSKDKVLYTDAKQRLGVIIAYKESLGKIAPYGIAKESDLPLPKRVIKIALIEELMYPRQLVEGTLEKNIDFLEGCLFMLDSFVSQENYEVEKQSIQMMEHFRNNQEYLLNLDPESLYKLADSVNFTTQEKLTKKNNDSLELIGVLKKFRKGNREKEVVDLLCEFIRRA